MNQQRQVITIAGKGVHGFKDGNAQDAMFFGPEAICYSNDRRIYVSDSRNRRIRMIYNDQVTTIAGNGQRGFKDGNALEAMFGFPLGICISSDGRIYVSDYVYHRIRMIYNNQVTTIAGNSQPGFQDGNALEAKFHLPHGICISNDGKIYVADYSNLRIRMIYNNQVTTIAGNGEKGFKDGNALEATFNGPQGICISNDGRIFVVGNYDHRIRMVYNNQVTTIAGNGQPGFQDGNALEAKFDHPQGIWVSNDSKIYVTDYHRITIINNNQVTTIAGKDIHGFKDGNAQDAMFHNPCGMCISNDDRLIVVDSKNHRIRMINLNKHYLRDLEKSLFGFGLLLDMRDELRDSQISFNNVTYHLHSTLVNLRCPLLLNQSYFSLIEKSSISSKSFQSFVHFLYSNTFTREYDQTLSTLSIGSIVELTFIFELFRNCKWILIDLNKIFEKQLVEMLEMEQEESVKTLMLDLLPLIYNLKQLINTKYLTSDIKPIMSRTQYCYNRLVDELQKRRLTAAQHIADLQLHVTPEAFATILKDIMSATSEIEIPDLESMIFYGCGLAELSKLAFYKTNICNMDKNETNIESTSVSTKNLDKWTRPDFVITLDNDEVEYHVHKIVLCGRWKYFCQMIESGLKEARDNRMTLSDDWNKSRFEKMMKYIYLNEIEFDDLNDIAWSMKKRKLYRITVDRPQIQNNKRDDQSKKNENDEIAAYGFEQLYDHCIEALHQPLALSNCVSLYSMFEEIGLPSLVQAAFNFISTNLLTLMKNKTTRNQLRKIQHEKIANLFFAHFDAEE